MKYEVTIKIPKETKLREWPESAEAVWESTTETLEFTTYNEAIRYLQDRLSAVNGFACSGFITRIDGEKSGIAYRY